MPLTVWLVAHYGQKRRVEDRGRQGEAGEGVSAWGGMGLGYCMLI